MKKLIFVLLLATSTMSWAISDPTKKWYFEPNLQGYEIYIDLESIYKDYSYPISVGFWIYDNVVEKYYRITIACKVAYVRMYRDGNLVSEGSMDPGHILWNVKEVSCGF